MPEDFCERVRASAETKARRLDVFVADWLRCSTKEAARRCARGEIRIHGRVGAKGDPVPEGAEVEYRPARSKSSAATWLRKDAAPDVEIVYEDDDLLVLHKPAGIPTHPLAPGEGNTAADAAFRACEGVATASDDPREGGAGHRLDTGTSGLLAFAKSPVAWRWLREEFLAGRVGRTYLAIVEGQVPANFRCEAPIAHHPKDRKRMVVCTTSAPDEGDSEGDSSGAAQPPYAGHRARAAKFRGHPQAATTIVEVLASNAAYSCVRAIARGGRRHQVRVHLAAEGFPLVGDVLYGAATNPGRDGHALHASELRVPGKPALRCAAPEDFAAMLERCGLRVA